MYLYVNFQKGHAVVRQHGLLIMSTSIVFPLPLPVHIVFGVIGTLFFIWRYAVKKEPHFLLLSISFASTFLIYICSEGLPRTILGIEELILFILILISMFISSRKNAAKEKAATEEENNEDSNA